MAYHNPKGRANYEPNSWGTEGGTRENPSQGLQSFAAEETGPKGRVRPESFADHYSQARQFYLSQTQIEQKHIGDALIFELSKCERLEIRARMVSHLLNIDPDLARTVANGLGLSCPHQPRRPGRRDKISPLPMRSVSSSAVRNRLRAASSACC